MVKKDKVKKFKPDFPRTGKGIKTTEEFIKMVENINEKNDGSFWSMSDVFGFNSVDMTEFLQKHDILGYHEIARFLREDLNMSDFQVGFGIGTALMNEHYTGVLRRQQEAQQIANIIKQQKGLRM